MCAGWNDEDEISSAELRPQVVEALLMLLSQAPLLLCHLDNDLVLVIKIIALYIFCLLYTSPSPRDRQKSRMPSSA